MTDATGRRLAAVQVAGMGRIDAIYAGLSDAVEAEVMRWQRDDEPLSAGARAMILAAVAALLLRARPQLVGAVIAARQGAIAAAQHGYAPLPADPFGESAARLEIARTVDTGTPSVLRQLGAVLATGTVAGLAVREIAKQAGDYFSPWFAPRRNVAGTLTRAGRQGAIQSWPGRAGMASQHPRAVMLYQTTEAHGTTLRRIAGRDGLYLQWTVSPGHAEADACDLYAERDSGLGRGVYHWRDAPKIPEHPRCFPAGVVVMGSRAIASTERWYEGDLVEIVTAGGLHLPVTPNHPILTNQGWVAAGLLQIGDHVICDRFGEGISQAINPDEQQVPSLIEDVARTLRGTLTMTTVRVPSSSIDFHGDGMGGEVCIVRADSLLRDGGDATISQPSLHQQLIGAGVKLSRFSRDGGLAPHLETVGLAALGGVSGLGVGEVFLRTAQPGHQAISVRNTTEGDVRVQQTPTNSAATDAQRDSNAVFGLTSEIAIRDVVWQNVGTSPSQLARLRAAPTQHTTLEQLIAHTFCANASTVTTDGNGDSVFIETDRVVKTERMQFAGHVYNLETRNGWYNANGIIVHNCRCHYVALAVGDEGLLRP